MMKGKDKEPNLDTSVLSWPTSTWTVQRFLPLTRWSFNFLFHSCGDFKGFFWLLVACCVFCLALFLSYFSYLLLMLPWRVCICLLAKVTTLCWQRRQGVPKARPVGGKAKQCQSVSSPHDTGTLSLWSSLLFCFCGLPPAGLGSLPGLSLSLFLLISPSLYLCLSVAVLDCQADGCLSHFKAFYHSFFFSNRVFLSLSLNASRWVCFDGRI